MIFTIDMKVTDVLVPKPTELKARLVDSLTVNLPNQVNLVSLATYLKMVDINSDRFISGSVASVSGANKSKNLIRMELSILASAYQCLF